MPKKNFFKRIFSAGIATVMACSMMAVPAFAAVDQIDIDVRVMDQSTGRIIEDVAMLTAYAEPGSGYVQSEDFQVPSLSTLTDVDFGRVEKVMGNYYFPVGQVSEGSMIEWSTNNRNGTLTYYKTKIWPPPFLRSKDKERQSRPYQKRRARNYSGLCFSEQLWAHGFA